MIGKQIRLNDYKFTYGRETIYLNVYGAFKNKKNGNTYVIYSYDNSKLYFGSLFIRNKEIIVMIPKEDESEIVKKFTYSILDNKLSDDFEVISLDDIDSIQIIDETLCDFNVDMSKLYDITIPKPKVEKEEIKPHKKISIASIFCVLLFVVIILFFFVNPEVIFGKNKEYSCTKSYLHDELPASVNEEVVLVFNGKDNINSIDVKTDYVFSDAQYYKDFKDKSYFYDYFKEGDTYKFEDTTYTYRLFSKIDTNEDYFMPSKLDDLVSYYRNNGYECKVVEVE
mgnify:CR=1 FL=1